MTKVIAQAAVPVTFRAVTQRINRELAKRQQCLKAACGKVAREQFGDYYVVGDQGVVTANVVVETLGRELGVLQPWERLCND